VIPRRFFLYWSAPSLSYMRFLCIKSLRYFHPDWEIVLYYAPCSPVSKSWSGDICQDFEAPTGDDYMSRLDELNVKVMTLNETSLPVHGSDLFRYIELEENGGIYVDTDIFWTGSIDEMYDDFCNSDQVISHSTKLGFQIGLLAASPGSLLFNDWTSVAYIHFQKGGQQYQCCGVDALVCLLGQTNYKLPIDTGTALAPWLLDALLGRYDKTYILDGDYLYGIDGGNARSIFEGNLGGWEPKLFLHLYGGSPTFQWYNSQVTPENFDQYNGPFFDVVRSVFHGG